MNRDDIIDWVTQVDMAFLKRIEPWNMFDKYEAFAKLVAQRERLLCSKFLQETLNPLKPEYIDQIEKGIWND